MSQVQWPAMDLAILFNMLISAGIGLVAGFVGGWIGHMFATLRDRQSRKWQELNYWRNVLARYDREAQQIARVSIPMGYIYGEQEHDISMHPPLEQRLMIQARAARLRVEALAKDLNIDPGLPSLPLPVHRPIVHLD